MHNLNLQVYKKAQKLYHKQFIWETFNNEFSQIWSFQTWNILSVELCRNIWKHECAFCICIRAIFALKNRFKPEHIHKQLLQIYLGHPRVETCANWVEFKKRICSL